MLRLTSFSASLIRAFFKWIKLQSISEDIFLSIRSLGQGSSLHRGQKYCLESAFLRSCQQVLLRRWRHSMLKNCWALPRAETLHYSNNSHEYFRFNSWGSAFNGHSWRCHSAQKSWTDTNTQRFYSGLQHTHIWTSILFPKIRIISRLSSQREQKQ